MKRFKDQPDPSRTSEVSQIEPSLVEPSDGALEQYFDELKKIPLLGAEQERELAREIEALEIAHWGRMLSYRPALRVFAGAIAPHLIRRASKFEALVAKPGRPTDAEARAASRQLRALDPTRAGLHAADAAIRAAFAADDRARAYLQRVAEVRTDEQRAKARFVAANLRLVISMAKRYRRSGLPLEDLIQEGNVGLMRAVERFDPRRGFRFSTYASWWIRHGLTRAVADKARMVRIPVHALDEMSRIARATDLGRSQRGGAPPSAHELSMRTGIPEWKILRRKAEVRVDPPLSLDQSANGEGDATLYDRLPDTGVPDLDEEFDLAKWRARVERHMQRLKPIEATVLRLRFGLGDAEELTLKEIGERCRLSRERIRQLQNEALAKLRSAIAA